MPTSPTPPAVSSFRVIKGSLIQETYAAFRSWDFSKSKVENLDRIRAENTVQAASTNWLRDVRKILSARFDPEGPDRALVRLCQQDPGIEAWRPMLLWHMAQGEFLLKDFLTQWLFPRFQEGHPRFAPKDLVPHLSGLARPGGPVEEPWTETTTQRVATALLKMGADFGLLTGGTTKVPASFHLAERAFLYVLHDLMDRMKNPRKVVECEDWRIFLMSPEAVHQELLRLHQYRRVEYHTAGSLVELRLPHPDLRSYVEGWNA